MHRTDERTVAQRGRTIIEMALAVSILATMTLPVAMAEDTGFSVFREVAAQSTATTKNRRAIDKITNFVISAGLDGLKTLPESPYWYDGIKVDNLVAVSKETANLTWRAAKIVFQYEPGERNDGKDNDNDGMIDEGRVVVIQDYGTLGAREMVICSNVSEYLEGEKGNSADDNKNGLVDEKGLCFTRVGDKLVIHLTVLSKNEEGGFVKRTMSSTVGIRN